MVKVVGFITESNQFVQINMPIVDDFNDEIPTKKDYNLTEVDSELMKNIHEKDEERELFIKQMRLENQFYNAFSTNIKWYFTN